MNQTKPETLTDFIEKWLDEFTDVEGYDSCETTRGIASKLATAIKRWIMDTINKPYPEDMETHDPE